MRIHDWSFSSGRDRTSFSDTKHRVRTFKEKRRPGDRHSNTHQRILINSLPITISKRKGHDARAGKGQMAYLLFASAQFRISIFTC